ncbi:glycosyltransferase [Mucilaginibacter calamicampi]|uniref:Glycosyltransferase n=1 Tax=Mucilaginibacter calamicampi TaxID=1302352 RepID=A0ABW2YSK6_9SPHI
MVKRVLIISPHFPPQNAADMHRVRMSLPYFREFGWEAEVVVVEDKYVDLVRDPILLNTIPDHIKIHKVRAFSKAVTSKFGLGNIALRSIWFYFLKVNQLLRTHQFDLIYFSTTQFPVCVLGAYWKKRFNVPYVIDMQDPWYSDYYEDKAPQDRPPKYWFSHRMSKYLEPIAIKNVDGLISVSENYITILKKRYPVVKDVPQSTIPFGAYAPDLKIAAEHRSSFGTLLQPGFKNIVYVGRGGADMRDALVVLFEALKKGLETMPEQFTLLRCYFIGTSYAPAGMGEETIMPLARAYGVEKYIVEITDRISYYYTLNTLQQADALFVPGSNDPNYTASKIYPYILMKKPLLALFHHCSPALAVLKEYGASFAYSYDETPDLQAKVVHFFAAVSTGTNEPVHYNEAARRKYDAVNRTEMQCVLFDEVIKMNNG